MFDLKNRGRCFSFQFLTICRHKNICEWFEISGKFEYFDHFLCCENFPEKYFFTKTIKIYIELWLKQIYHQILW